MLALHSTACGGGFAQIAQVACGMSHSLMLDTAGRAWLCGQVRSYSHREHSAVCDTHTRPAALPLALLAQVCLQCLKALSAAAPKITLKDDRSECAQGSARACPPVCNSNDSIPRTALCRPTALTPSVKPRRSTPTQLNPPWTHAGVRRRERTAA